MCPRTFARRLPLFAAGAHRCAARCITSSCVASRPLMSPRSHGHRAKQFRANAGRKNRLLVAADGAWARPSAGRWLRSRASG